MGRREEWERAGVWGDGEGKEELFLPEQWGVFVPPEVRMEGSFLVYSPWPEGEDLQGLPAERIGSVRVHFVIPWLLKNGWRRREKTERLLAGFLALPELTPETADKYAAFARRYGPLWQQGILAGGRQPLSAWGHTRREIVAAFNIAAALKEGKATRAQDWADIGYPGEEGRPPELQRRVLAAIITQKLEGIKLELTWDAAVKITINTGLGFLNVAWLQVAQMISGRFSLCVCDGCGRLYVRMGRKPQRGRYNFCPECGEGHKGSKRLWARNNKARG
ncbi:MAG: hypothetical protein ACUVTQ_07120 [Desulfotomaculales bacterium]